MPKLAKEPVPPPEPQPVVEEEDPFAWVQKTFEFQGVKFVWDDKNLNYKPINPPEGYFRVLMSINEDLMYDASVAAAESVKWPAYTVLWGDGVASDPQDALRIAITGYAEALDLKAQNLVQHAEMVRRRADGPWQPLPETPEWEGNFGKDSEQ